MLFQSLFKSNKWIWLFGWTFHVALAVGGAMMHLADEKERTELVLKSAGGKTYLGPAGEAPLAEDREVVSIEPKLMIMRYADPDVAARYGTSIYVRCGA